MVERFRQITYGEQIDSIVREIDRVSQIAKRFPQRVHEVDQGHDLLLRVKAQMKARGKRRSSCFYGFEDINA